MTEAPPSPSTTSPPTDPARLYSPRVTSRVTSSRRWSRAYLAGLVAGDVASVAAAVVGCWLAHWQVTGSASLRAYSALGAVLVAGWLFCVQVVGGYEWRNVGVGAREYQRILRAGMNLAGSVAIVGYLSGMLIARAFVAVAIPATVLVTIVNRWLARRALYRRRESGRWASSLLLVGTSDSVRHLADELARTPRAGLMAIGACVEDTPVGEDLLPGVPVLSDTAGAAAVARAMEADVVAVANSGLGPGRIRDLAWQLQDSRCQMVMAPGLTGIAGPRCHVTPMEGLPLVWVDRPRFTGFGRVTKRGLDVIGSMLLLILCAPVLLAIAVAIRATSRGPAIFRQKRLGKDGEWVTVLKFRTMYADAETRLAELAHLNESADPLFFKIRRDPRVTPLGRFLRRWSLDELPQLCNVVGGSMSLVGPRPLPGELDLYSDHFRRRLLVKPGLTGLWQVSGRSDLSADDAVRLDLYYVENWSLTLDLAIIARTMWVVLRTRGAY